MRVRSSDGRSYSLELKWYMGAECYPCKYRFRAYLSEGCDGESVCGTRNQHMFQPIRRRLASIRKREWKREGPSRTSLDRMPHGSPVPLRFVDKDTLLRSYHSMMDSSCKAGCDYGSTPRLFPSWKVMTETGRNYQV